MATGTTASTAQPRPPASSKAAGYDQFIDQQLRRTRTQVRLVDVASGLLVLGTASLAYFLAMAILDHWVVAGGLPGWARVTALVIYLLVAGWYFLVRILPLLVKRINPLYAAETIERTQPSLKNSLLNFLQFRARPQGLSESVYHAVEEQAAARLAHVPIETVVDRSKLIRIGYVLVGVLAVCALYKVLSPKDPVATFGRIVMPWADILPPTRVSIDNIEPGNSKAFRGQRVTISAEVRGLERDGEVRLIYSTADGQTVDRTVEMNLPKDGYRHTCILPPDEDGIQQTLRYRIVAGDARSREYTLSVVAAPTIVVDSVEYVYPDYTGLLSQKIEHQGDIKAIEGTRVVVHAVTNQPIKDGGIDFECDEHEDLPIIVDGTGDLARGGSVAFSLALEDDRVTPTHSSYQLRFRNADGDSNQQPLRYAIEVVPDLPPEVEFLAPKANEVRMREGDALPIELTASDPDFALKSLKLIAEVGGKRLFEKQFLKSEWRGQLNQKFRLSSKEHQLKAGDVVDYWLVATDTKSPVANTTESVRRRVQIVPRDAKGQQQDQPQDQNQPPLEGEPEKPQQGEQGGNGDPSQQENPADGENAKDQGGDKGDQGDPSDSGEADPSDDSKPGDSGGEDSKSQSGSDENGDQQSDAQNGEQAGKSGESKDGEGQQGNDDGDGKEGQAQDGGSGQQQNGNQGDQQNSPVANDGTQDGEAIEKMQEHLQKKGDQNSDSADQQQGNGQTKNDNPGSKPSPEQNKQTPGTNGGEEKPSDKQPQDGGTKEEDSGDASGNENKGEQQPGQSGNPNAEKKPGEDGAMDGQEQAGDASKDAKKGKNSQKGEATDAVSDKAKEEQGQPDKAGKAEKTNQNPKGTGKPEDRQGEANSGNERDQQGDNQSDQKGAGEHAAGQDKGDQKKNDKAQERDKAKGGSDQQKGQSGSGQETKDNQGSPESQGEGRQRNKTPKPSAGKQDDEGKQDPQSPSNSNRESDSDPTDSEGDRSGSGGKGGGQGANQPGTGKSGKNTASDEGDGKSSEQGSGETGEKAGSQQESDSKTGKSGDQAGNGSNKRPGEKAGQGESQSKPQANGDPSNQQTQKPGGAGQGTAQGASGGGEKGTDGNPPSGPGGEPGGDEANLEYARKATDLVLDRLRDQLAKGEPDQELLDKLGWTRDDLEKFVRRWERMKAQANDRGSKGEEAKRELDATLRSLGLSPRGTTLTGDRNTSDAQRGLKESRRTSPPPEYAEQYKAYTQGTARGGK